MISFRVGFTATSLTGIAICVGTLTPSLAMMSPPGGDRLHHLIAFSAFALPMVLVERQYWRLMLTLTLLLGTAIELIQPHINHSGDPMDILANAAGGIIGVLIGITISRLHHHYLLSMLLLSMLEENNLILSSSQEPMHTYEAFSVSCLFVST